MGLPLKSGVGIFIVVALLVTSVAFKSILVVMLFSPFIMLAIVLIVLGFRQRGVEHLVGVLQAGKADEQLMDLGIKEVE